MKLSEFKGMDSKLDRLMRNTQNGKLIHAMMFNGPEGTGKRSMAELMARAALCDAKGERPCDVCPTCKKCLDGVHPDVHIIEPPKDKKQITIEQIRELISSLALASYEGGKKIVIIDKAEAMNNAAQNALLKTLEEPTGDTLFFLLTASPATLLPTIRSRCLSVRFAPLETGECAGVLKERGIEPAKAELCASLAAGCVGRALTIAGNEQYFELRSKVLEAVQSIHSEGDVPNAIATLGLGKLKDQNTGWDILEILELWAWDLMRVQNGNSPIEIRENDKLRSSKINGNKLLRAVAEAKQNRNVNVTWTNTLEPILFAIARQ